MWPRSPRGWSSMDFKHTPVLFEECMKGLDIRPGGTYVDGTLGGAGHSLGITERMGPEGTLIGIDRDEEALKAAEQRLAGRPGNIILVNRTYAEIKDILAEQGVDQINGALLDIGVSSYQLDNEERGFSYMKDAPLDMRMDRKGSFSAWDVVNGYEEDRLAELIRDYGEERWARRIASFIVRERKNSPIETTGELTEIIKAAIPASARRDGPHPAKRTFQAIRIEVNGELDQLARACDAYCDVLAPGGRLAIITFHSLEDRIVKEAFGRRLNPCTCPKDLPCVCGKKPDVRKVTGKPIIPTEEERETNPRARSAKLRIIEKR